MQLTYIIEGPVPQHDVITRDMIIGLIIWKDKTSPIPTPFIIDNKRVVLIWHTYGCPSLDSLIHKLCQLVAYNFEKWEHPLNYTEATEVKDFLDKERALIELFLKEEK